MDSEQWKSGGDCRACRRQKYCRTKCSANKRLMDVIIHEAIRKTKAGRLMEAARAEMRSQGVGPYDKG